MRLQTDLIQVQAMNMVHKVSTEDSSAMLPSPQASYPLQEPTASLSTGSKALPCTTRADDLEFENSPLRQDSKESQEEGLIFFLSLIQGYDDHINIL